MMHRMCSVQQALLVVGVLQTASGALLVDSGMLVGWGSAKPDVLSMVCYPASCSGESATDTVVHSIVKSDAWVSERTTINSMAYPASDVPKALALSACVNVSEGEDYSPGVETFSMTFVAAGTGAYTEVGGDLFTARTNLVRRANLIVGNTEGLVATHDTFDLSDNWYSPPLFRILYATARAHCAYSILVPEMPVRVGASTLWPTRVQARVRVR